MIGLGLLGRHSTGLNRIWLVDAKGLNKVTVCPPKPISNLESLRGPFWVLCISHSIPLHWAAWSLNTLSLTTSMLMTASCMFPLHQGTLQQHWMVYSHVWPLSSHGCRPINWNWTQIKLNSSLLGTNDGGANTSLFPIELLGVKTNPAKSARNLGVIFDKNFTFRSHIAVVCNSCFYHMRDLRRIRHHLDLDSAKLLATALVSSRLDYCNSPLYGIADIDLTRLHVYRINWPAWWQSLLHLLAVFHCFVLFIGCQ